MLKGALPPTIVIAIHQSDAIADITLTIGYLSALISVLSQALMPRAKFMKIMFFDLLSTCISASLCCLAVYCAVEARKHNTPADATESVRNGFSSDACAVSAIWLIFMIWAANTLRALRPMELQDPMVAFSIFCSVTITRAGTFVTLSEGLSFIARLLKGFMIGFAIATGVSLFILPITSRGDVFHDVRGYVAQIDALLKAQIDFLIGSEDVWTGGKGLLSRTRTARSMRGAEAPGESGLEGKRKRLAAGMGKLNALHGKLQSDLFYSTDEFAWGKLSAEDLKQVGGLMRSLLLPLSGMAMLPEILEMVVNDEGVRDSTGDIPDEEEDAEKQALKHSEIQRVVQTLHERLVDASNLTTTGLQYVLLAFELIKPKHLERQPKAQPDEESRAGALSPLQQDFTSRFEHQLQEYYASRKHLPRALASLEAFSVPEKVTDYTSDDPRTLAADSDVRQEFFLILYMGHLQETLLKATLDLVKFADSKIADGTMKHNRVIFPKQNSIREWISLNPEKKESDSPPNRRQSSPANPPAGQFPDPEHLPPANVFEKGSTILRVISRVIRSEQSLFGFRVAAASFSVGILAFLYQTQDFFIHQRCIWAMIVIVIGMNPTSGQTMFGFMARIVATAISLVLSLIIWYIVDQKTAGVIVFLYLANVFEYYFYIKVPQYFGAAVISIVTLNVIIGYELQVRKLGLEAATSNGQPYYPIYLFGPYKLAAVAAGCAISFFWVIFPYPITAKSTLRKALGRGLFVLASGNSDTNNEETYTAIKTIDETRLTLETALHNIFKEEMMLLNQLRMHSHFSTFEPAIGGKFPKPVYDNIIGEIQRMLTSMALMAQTTRALDALAPRSSITTNTNTNPTHPDNRTCDINEQDPWISRLATIALHSPDFTSHATTSLLCHLSASLTNAQPLPPYLSTGDSFPLARELQKIDGEMLSIRHVEDPAFSAFVALEVLRSVVGFGLRGLLRDVKGLVGELSFDFHGRRGSLEWAETRRLMLDHE
ncbi:hypothetical protein N8T08_007428 [Aspergillus melleus]|uniref:Uncharacterized protein n=1 Tax=Aspergillus melleus TaxID=138277 RepID=A0ACC3AY31_9EURO|nr:hypothetical protein N8T08_007428 [Aspergillus melleus]